VSRVTKVKVLRRKSFGAVNIASQLSRGVQCPD